MKTSNHRLLGPPSGIMTAALAGTLFLVMAGAGQPARAAADDFFRAKQLRVLIGFSAGGGYDAYGRLLGMSRRLLKFIQQALLVDQATQPWSVVQGRG